MTPSNGNGTSIHERASQPQATPDPRDGIFDTPLSDPALEAALEVREAVKGEHAVLATQLKEATEDCKDHLAGLNLTVGEIRRVGRFRITKTSERFSIEVD